ncbi:aspartic proteinase-like protein 1 isoform X1 [Cinnamomum micranthum f. kanehirae]|uniref:Aspartic proteinase-like protein 1 isoform X1 n=1 Tax=Cinnamomum micranthum f. kanehirae TaxID=337451 RepID=A0A443PQJ8_9MAGN|nr:aspartic proteinase-like protein 1 isoform X1 [Cinnamomum micranthum f. kanehirae]
MATRFFVSLSLAFSLIGNACSYTFSSRLIHRFSDEAKAFMTSRNGGGEISHEWPRFRSMDHYRMLARSDLERQKMKLGAKYSALFPLKGSETMSFGNDFGWLHYTWIDIGTPNVSFLVALDTESDLFWVPCDCIQCAPLSANYYSLDRDLSVYSPSESRTSKPLSCSHDLCANPRNCKSPDQPCPYTVSYFSENTSSSGMLVEDTLYLMSNDTHASSGTVQTPVIIGCGRKQTGGYLDGIAPDGLLGLGFGDISVPSFLAKAGLVRNSFSMCFNEDDSGRIFIGDQGMSTQQSTPFLAWEGKYVDYSVGVDSFCIGTACLKHTGFRALVDSGTSFTFLPADVYERVTVEFDRQMNASSFIPDGDPWEYCYKASSLNLPEIPTVTLMFAENISYVVRNPIFPYFKKGELVGFCLALQSAAEDIGTIGQNFMTGYRIVFDRENLKLGWSPSNCRDLDGSTRVPLTAPPHHGLQNPLPASEQQNSPGSHAVSPAVAGRTPPNHAAALPFTGVPFWQFCLLRLLVPSFFIVVL